LVLISKLLATVEAQDYIIKCMQKLNKIDIQVNNKKIRNKE